MVVELKNGCIPLSVANCPAKIAIMSNGHEQIASFYTSLFIRIIKRKKLVLGVSCVNCSAMS
jgi:hypothetical protein